MTTATMAPTVTPIKVEHTTRHVWQVKDAPQMSFQWDGKWIEPRFITLTVYRESPIYTVEITGQVLQNGYPLLHDRNSRTIKFGQYWNRLEDLPQYAKDAVRKHLPKH